MAAYLRPQEFGTRDETHLPGPANSLRRHRPRNLPGRTASVDATSGDTATMGTSAPGETPTMSTPTSGETPTAATATVKTCTAAATAAATATTAAERSV
jgi:hypothetical protein